MKSLSLLFALNALGVAMSSTSSPFAGEWPLVETMDGDNQAVPLPEGTFTFVIEDIDTASLQVYIKVGNNMRTKITLEEGESESSKKIRVGGVLSTMMMPAKDLFQLETYLSRTLPKMDVISVQDGTLTLEGAGEGKIICKQV
jgi:hypothetical protein